jgi:hypothetical protein
MHLLHELIEHTAPRIGSTPGNHNLRHGEEAQMFMLGYEYTFCADCIEGVLGNVCLNCGGRFVARPIRPSKTGRLTPSEAIGSYSAIVAGRHSSYLRLLLTQSAPRPTECGHQKLKSRRNPTVIQVGSRFIT